MLPLSSTEDRKDSVRRVHQRTAKLSSSSGAPATRKRKTVHDVGASFGSDGRSRDTVELAMTRNEVRDSRQPIDTAVATGRMSSASGRTTMGARRRASRRELSRREFLASGALTGVALSVPG